MVPHAVAGCAAGACTVASCEPGYVDLDHDPSNGCEYACTVTGVEVCDGEDNDCDGHIDNGLTAPITCLTQGECAGTVATCGGAAGWECAYGPTVSTDGHGAIIPETLCDGKDNDCDGKVDETQAPLLGMPCHDDKLGVCQTSGTYVCNTTTVAAQNGPAVCNNAHVGGTASPEACNGLDDDCDGVVDNGAATW